MEIEVTRLQNYVSNGKIEVYVEYHEMIGDLGFSATVNVWIPAIDSRSEIISLAKAEARKFLERALSIHSD